jgi:hypothetical protein
MSWSFSDWCFSTIKYSFSSMSVNLEFRVLNRFWLDVSRFDFVVVVSDSSNFLKFQVLHLVPSSNVRNSSN